MVVACRSREQSNSKVGTVSRSHFAARDPSGGVDEAGLGGGQHKVGAVAFDERILKADSPWDLLNCLLKNKTLQLRQRLRISSLSV